MPVSHMTTQAYFFPFIEPEPSAFV